MHKQKTVINESELQIIWGLGLFRKDNLMTEDSKHLIIEFAGIPNLSGGPDFKNARLKINNQSYIGDVELHLLSKDWLGHNHENNLEYGNVILHVALWRDQKYPLPKHAFHRQIYELILEPFLEESLLSLKSKLKTDLRIASPPNGLERLDSLVAILNQRGLDALNQKVGHFETLINEAGLSEAVYREIMCSLGYKHNKAQFEQLSFLVPYSRLKEFDAESIEKLLLYKAGFIDDCPAFLDDSGIRLPKSIWRRRNVRPSNYPEVRIRAASRLFANLNHDMASNITSNLDKLYQAAEPSGVPGKFAGLLIESSGQLIGRSRALEIFFNVIAPFLISIYKQNKEYEKAKFITDVYNLNVNLPENLMTRYVKKIIFGDKLSEFKSCLSTPLNYLGLLKWYTEMFGG